MSGPASPPRSRIAHFKAPFVISAAGSAALALGCGLLTHPDRGTCDKEDRPSVSDCGGWICVEGEWQPRWICNPPPPPQDLYCEPTLPVPGSDCAVPAVNCSYPGGCAAPSTAVCVSGQWLVTYSSGPACNPPAVVPVCPERQLVTGNTCAYEGQECGNEACESGAAARDAHVCSSGLWQAAVVSCPPGDSLPDAGASDAGARDGGG